MQTQKYRGVAKLISRNRLNCKVLKELHHKSQSKRVTSRTTNAVGSISIKQLQHFSSPIKPTPHYLAVHSIQKLHLNLLSCTSDSIKYVTLVSHLIQCSQLAFYIIISRDCLLWSSQFPTKAKRRSSKKRQMH